MSQLKLEFLVMAKKQKGEVSLMLYWLTSVFDRKVLWQPNCPHNERFVWEPTEPRQECSPTAEVSCFSLQNSCVGITAVSHRNIMCLQKSYPTSTVGQIAK